MGHGIAQVAAASGYEVLMRDIDEAATQRGMKSIERNLAKGIERGKVSEQERDETLSRIRVTTDFAEIGESDLVIEAAPENLELKQSLLRQTEELVTSNCIFATNTSSLSINEIAKVSNRRADVVGMHFFNPVHIMRLVEIVVGGETSEETTATVREVARSMKKEPIVVRDVPGFASSRLGVTLGLEAMRMVEQGVASARDIDTAMELGYNHPVGPLKLTDMVGLDVRLSIAEYLHETLESETFRPPDILRRMVSEGKFRQDLFFRLHVLPVKLPPLRERREDIPLLVQHFVAKLAPKTNARVRAVSDAALGRIMAYHWPGNVRELENAIEQSLVFAEGDEIGPAALPQFLQGGAEEDALNVPREMSLPEILDDLERQLILKAYAKAGRVKTETARLLGIKTSALYYKLEKYGIE